MWNSFHSTKDAALLHRCACASVCAFLVVVVACTNQAAIVSQSIFLTNIWTALFEKETWKEKPLRLRCSKMLRIWKEKSAKMSCVHFTKSLGLPWHYLKKFQDLRILRKSSKNRDFLPEQIQSCDLNLWKSCVLPHFLLFLRYISDVSQVQTLQAGLNRSLSTTMHVYGHPTALLAETGIPPLYITQNMQLAQLRFRLFSAPPATIQHFLWQLWQPLLQLVPLNTFETRMQTAVCHVDMAPWPCFPNASKCECGQTPWQREVIWEISWVPMLWPVAETSAYTEWPTRASASIRPLASP